MSRVRPLALWSALIAGYLALLVLVAVALISYPPPDDFPRRCGLLIGGWHPDVPVRYAERCRARERDALRSSLPTSPR